MEKLLLTSQAAVELYDRYAKDMPIFDCHSHVSARDIYEDKRYSNLSQLWLEGDHYKWRLMRMCGVDEYYITGEAEDYEKFLKFAEILPLCIGNPVYTWCHMELEKYFGYKGVLNADTAQGVWDACTEVLSREDFGVREIIRMSRVEFIGTTNDPCEELEYHKRLACEGLPFTVSPTFRPDEYINIEKEDYAEKISRLASASGMAIDGEKTLKCALRKRMNYFLACGCTSSDHGLNYIKHEEASAKDIDRILKKALDGASLSLREIDAFKFYMLVYLSEQYAELGWVMQIHYNCLRNPNTRAYKGVGIDAGFDCILRRESSEDIAILLDKMNEGKMPKIILYSLDGGDNAFLDVLCGSFASGEPFGRVAHGAAWWHNDTKEGISAHLRSLASHGVLGNFTGMLTDSRSFLSYVRHDYFRRILCSVVADFYNLGEYSDHDSLGKIICGISYDNTKKFFGTERYL